jgi:hypothetical protein
MLVIFGLYPGGAAGSDTGLVSGPPDDYAQVTACLDELQGNVQPFVVRAYDSFQDAGSPLAAAPCAPAEYWRLASPGRPLDLVLQFRSAVGDVDGFSAFVAARIERHHRYLYSVQITEEPNFTDGPPIIDGHYREVRRALVAGVLRAKDVLTSVGSHHVKVGFNATPTFGPGAAFWSELGGLGGERFTRALDYVGLDFFPDVFRPIAADGQTADLAGGVKAVMEVMRTTWLPNAGIADSVPIHVTEHGWPTGAGRTEARQAAIVETVVGSLHGLAETLNIERYMHFALRDAQHEQPGTRQSLFHFFGLTRADYGRKAAFETYRRLIEQCGAR